MKTTNQKIRLLVITHIYPNNIEPAGGIFNQYQLAALKEYCEIKVIAPLPWFPGLSLFPKTAEFAFTRRVALREIINDIEVIHPLFFAIPKIGRFLHGIFYFLCIMPSILQMRREFPFNLIYSIYAYPDTFAASLVALLLKVPHIAKVLGSDINIIANTPLRGRLIRFALAKADKIIAVSEDLKNKTHLLGIDTNKTMVLYNGVDKKVFHKTGKETSRIKLSLQEKDKIILFVGNLKTIKGLAILIETFEDLAKEDPLLRLYIIGEGPQGEYFRKMIERKQLITRISLPGSKSPEEVAVWMNAADVFCLPSLNEGIPNVIMESLSCGTPVVATRVGGIPEIIVSEDMGLLVEPNDARGLAAALRKAFGKNWDGKIISKKTDHYTWENNARLLYSTITATLDPSGSYAKGVR